MTLHWRTFRKFTQCATRIFNEFGGEPLEDTDLMDDIFFFVQNYYERNSVLPTIGEFEKTLGL